MNYDLVGGTHQVSYQVTHQVTPQDSKTSKVSDQILNFCIEPQSKKDIALFCGFKDLRNFTLKISQSAFKIWSIGNDYP